MGYLNIIISITNYLININLKKAANIKVAGFSFSIKPK